MLCLRVQCYSKVDLELHETGRFSSAHQRRCTEAKQHEGSSSAVFICATQSAAKCSHDVVTCGIPTVAVYTDPRVQREKLLNQVHTTKKGCDAIRHSTYSPAESAVA
jgi:hypothetical protein